MTRIRITRQLNLVYAEHADGPLYCDVLRPDSSEVLPVILVAHGGGWCTGDRAEKAAESMRLAREGYVVVNIDYRLAPAHPFPAAYDDLMAAAAWIRQHIAEYGGDAMRLGAYGVSAGGHLVGLCAIAPGTPFVCAVSWGGPMDLRTSPVTAAYEGYVWAFLAACPHDAPDRYAAASPRALLHATMPPLLLVHGTADDVVPVAQAVRMRQAAEIAIAPVECYLIDGAGHAPGDPREPRMGQAWDRVVAFLAAHLKDGNE